MTALNQTYTTSYNLQTGPRRLPAGDSDAPVRFLHVRDTAVSGQGTFNLGILPPGNIRIYKQLSRLYTGTAVWTNGGVTLTIGWAAYTDYAGTSQVANAAGLHDSVSPQGGVIDEVPDGFSPPYLDFNTQNGLTLTATTATADKAAADVLDLLVAFSEIGAGT